MPFFSQKFFTIAGPCNLRRHYMLPPLSRIPQIWGIIGKGQCFVVHAQRQCGKTTAFGALTREINDGTDAVALYCSLEVAQEFPIPERGLPVIYRSIRTMARQVPQLRGAPELADDFAVPSPEDIVAGGITNLLSSLAVSASKPLVVFFDEADCLSGATMITFLRQLRNGYITSLNFDHPFPVSIALIGMRNIRDYKAKIRSDSESLGSSSPFNIIVQATTLRQFTKDEIRELYNQHTQATGQCFTEEALELAWLYSQGQPYLVNALAKWCVEQLHHEDYSQPVTADDMHEAKEGIIRERGTHLDSLMERLREPQVRAIVEAVMLGDDLDRDRLADDLSYVMDLGLLKDEDDMLQPANPIYAEVIGRFLTWGTQQTIRQKIQKVPWIHEHGLDMSGLMTAFQQFWRENADATAVPNDYREAYPQLVLQAFLQRVINGGGEIIREMALGRQAMDLEVKFRGAIYAIECKKSSFYHKSHEKAYRQIGTYMDRLGLHEGWLVVFDPDLSKPWEEKIQSCDIPWQGKSIHLISC